MVVRIFFLHHVRVLHVAICAGNNGDRQRRAKHPMVVHRNFRVDDYGHPNIWLGSVQISEKSIPSLGLLFLHREHFDLFCHIFLCAK